MKPGLIVVRETSPAPKSWVVPVAVAAACGIGSVIWMALARDAGEVREPVPDVPDTPGRRTESEGALEAVVAQVAVESRNGPAVLKVEAAPRRVPMPNPGAPRVDAVAPLPPDGFTFVEHHGETETGRFRPRRDAGGSPPDDGPDWLRSPRSVSRLVGQAAAAGRDWSFGWIRAAPDAGLSDITRFLEDLDVVVEGSAGPLIRARLPGDEARLDAIMALSGVVAVGAAPGVAKLPPTFAGQALVEPAHNVVPVFVTLMANDQAGRWRRELERLGAEVGAYDADTRAYVANVEYGDVGNIAEADFVLFVEPVGTVEAAHDTAVPAMGADVHRTYDPMSVSFSGTGGATVPVGVLDSGLNINHLDIVSNRDSICGANFIVPSRAEDQDLWVDSNGHGTHVAGTIVGNGAATPAYAGMAPLVRDIRLAKVLNSRGIGPFTAVNAGMDFLSESSECSGGGWSSEPVKPLIVNMSVSSSSLRHEGRDQPARKLDAVVWGHRQLYVVAQSNGNIHGFSNYGAAKNSLPVGAALDGGELARFSSLGPTADGRLAPLVVGTGVGLYSAAGNGSRSGYSYRSGTSMSSPAVAGVAALLMDAVPSHREHPALARARLMASAVKPDAWFEDAGAFPSDNTTGPGTVNARFGLGKVSARTSILDRDRPDGWTSGSFTATFEDDEYAYHDIEVPEGAGRLDVVLTWDEPPTDAIANAVLNDLDLWLDHEADCAEVQCGERSSASRTDNVEWIIVGNPTPGTWRAKVAATRVYTDAPRAALAWTVIRDSATPELALSVDRSTMDGTGELTVAVSVNGYVAAGTRLHLECRASSQAKDDGPAEAVPCSVRGNSTVTNADGLVAAGSSVDAGDFVALGEIGVGESREVRFEYLDIGAASALHLAATSWNATAASISVSGGMDAADEATAVEPPENDAFAAAEILEGAEGNRRFDMLHAATEPGEPDYEPGSGRPAGSVWYRWKATAAGPVHFGALLDEAFRPSVSIGSGSSSLVDRELRLDVLEGNAVAGLRPVASAPWGASFFALPDREYRVRISNRARASRVDMHWRQGARPENDDFAAATAIDEEDESIAGTNLGATLEPGEYFGGLGGTVWYRWTAPDDGFWVHRVNADHLKVLAFSGDSLDRLRLVSGYPAAVVGFPARAGESYRIAVATADAFAAGGRFDLSWTMGEGPRAAQDDFAEAHQLPGVDASSFSASVAQYSTVEPGEPIDTGVRTRWWSWTPPATAEHTWRLVGQDPGMTLSAFSGDTLEGLSPLGVADATDIEFVFSADDAQAYRLSVGVSASHASAFVRDHLRGQVEFGPTPENDAWSSAAPPLTEASGTVAGSNRYATTEDHERIHGVGHSSLWWTFEAPADGWYRFHLDESDPSFTLAAFVCADVTAGQLEMIVSSRRGPDAGRAEIIFQASAGDRFAIRLGTFGNDQGGDFTLHWEETEAPTLLRYVGRFTPTKDSEGEIVEIENLRHMAFDATGQALYVASSSGLLVLGRDPDTGTLTNGQLLPGIQRRAAMLWDSDNTRLLAFNGCEVKVYSAVDGTFRRLRDDGTLSVAGGGYICHVDLVFTGPDRQFLYVARFWTDIQVFEYDDVDTLRHVQTLDLSLRNAVLSNAGKHVYAIENYSLYALERNEETGQLAELDHATLADQRWSLAVSDDDAYLFTSGRIPTLVHSLEDPGSPRLLRSLAPPTQGGRNLNCFFAAARNASHASDSFCVNSAHVVEWHADTENFVLADFVASWQPNNAGEQLPAFGNPEGLAASPDGRNAYVSTDAHGILIFERVGNPIVDIDAGGGGGYLRLATLSVSAGRVDFGSLSSAGCITIDDLSVNDVLYDVDVSKWQTRPDAAGTWADVEGTETTGEVCAYSPTETGQYRLVSEMDIDGEAGMYASNVIDHEAE